MTAPITAETMKAHRAVWYAYTGGRNADGTPERIRRTAQMRGQWGYDVVCSCGEWESRTGGGLRRYVEEELLDHRLGTQTAPHIEAAYQRLVTGKTTFAQELAAILDGG